LHVPGSPITDDEIVFRRVPLSEPSFEPPDRISTANYKLDQRRNELGLSVYRKDVVAADEVLARPDAIPGSFLTFAKVGDIRSLKDGKGEDLNLDVIAVDDEDDPGHPEIRGPEPGKLSAAAAKALRRLLQRWTG
jgi:hypothetical protein